MAIEYVRSAELTRVLEESYFTYTKPEYMEVYNKICDMDPDLMVDVSTFNHLHKLLRSGITKEVVDRMNETILLLQVLDS